MILNAIDDLKETTGESYARLCVQVGVSYSNLMRWQGRRGQGLPPVSAPGPRKLPPMDLNRLKAELENLSHGRKRTAGTGSLYDRYRDQLSRRQFRELVEAARWACRQRESGGRQRVYWNAPRLIWAVDDVHIGYHQNRKLWSNQIEDLTSRYKFQPQLSVGHVMDGALVAERLDRLFEINGAPLVLKRDNGGNLDCAEVDAVLERYAVVPLNSPCQYPRYNGGIEKAQREFKEALTEQGDGDHLEIADRLIRAQLATAKLNEQFRRCLHGHSSCWAFETGKPRQRRYTLRQRREVLEEMIVMATVAMTEPGGSKPLSPSAAWRLAVQSWLQFHGMITIAMERKVLPVFP